MRKKLLAVLILLLALLLCACSETKFDESQIVNDLNGQVFLSNFALPISELSVDELDKDESGEQITADITVEAANGLVSLRGCYTAYYSLIEKEWTLSGFYEDRSRGWEISPVGGITAEDAELEVGEGWTLVDSSEDLSKGICSFCFQKEEKSQYNKRVIETWIEYRFSPDTITWNKIEADPLVVSSEWDILGKWQTVPSEGYLTSGWSANNFIEITSVTETSAHVLAETKGLGGVFFEGDVPLDPSSGIEYKFENPYDSWKSFTLIITPDEAELKNSGTLISFETLLKAEQIEKPEFVTPAVTDMTYAFDEETKTATIRSYKGSDHFIRLPEQVDGYTITAIEDEAFAWNKTLIQIELPDTVKSIGDRAFCKCESLRSIALPNGLESIGEYCFSTCFDLIDLTLPESVSRIGCYAFENCRLDDFTLPGNVTEIPDGLFYSTTLLSISMGDNVTSIGNSAFSGCYYLGGIKLPGSVQSIGDRAFSGCSRLTSIKLNDGLTTLGSEVFSGCESFTELVIPESVTTMGYEIFRNCDSLTDITLSSVCPIIPWNCFAACDALTDITIPEGVETIEEYAFTTCESLNTITLPKSLKEIAGSFSNCSRLTTVYYAGTEAEWSEINIPENGENEAILEATLRCYTQ